MIQTIKVKNSNEVPDSYTGIAEFDNGDNGDKVWFLNGKWHRENGPAIEGSDGSKCWFLYGAPYRKDGPAIESANGSKQWYSNGSILFSLPSKSQPFIIVEEFVDEEGKRKIKVLNQTSIEIWPCVPGLKEQAENFRTEGVQNLK